MEPLALNGGGFSDSHTDEGGLLSVASGHGDGRGAHGASSNASRARSAVAMDLDDTDGGDGRYRNLSFNFF